MPPPSATSSGSSHALAWWMLVLVVGPVLYLLLLPPFFLGGARLDAWDLFSAAPWVDALCAPNVWLESNTPMQGPLDAYAGWWTKAFMVESHP